MYRARYGMYTPGRQICDSWSDSHSFDKQQGQEKRYKISAGRFDDYWLTRVFFSQSSARCGELRNNPVGKRKSNAQRTFLIISSAASCLSCHFNYFVSQRNLSVTSLLPGCLFLEEKKTGKEFDAETWVFVLTVLQFASLFDFRRVLEGSIVAGAGFQIWKL